MQPGECRLLLCQYFYFFLSSLLFFFFLSVFLVPRKQEDTQRCMSGSQKREEQGCYGEHGGSVLQQHVSALA